MSTQGHSYFTDTRRRYQKAAEDIRASLQAALASLDEVYERLGIGYRRVRSA